MSGNETRTRMALIDPLLTVLGWDVSNPALVTPEYRVDVGWADYALRGVGNTPATVIEAKRLGSIVENHLDQAVGYCIQQGVAYAGVTDGSHWRLYRTFEPVPMADNIVLDVNIENTPAHQCALQLLLLWQPNLASGQPMPANEPIKTVGPTTHATLSATEPVPTAVSSNTPPSGDGWIRLSEFNPPTGTGPPSAIRFSDGINVAIRSWRQIPTAVAGWLHLRQILTVDKLPVPSGRRGYAANFEPFHRDGSPMLNHESIGETSIFINVHLSARASRENTKKILEHCGINPDNVQLQVGE